MKFQPMTLAMRLLRKCVCICVWALIKRITDEETVSFPPDIVECEFDHLLITAILWTWSWQDEDWQSRKMERICILPKTNPGNVSLLNLREVTVSLYGSFESSWYLQPEVSRYFTTRYVHNKYQRTKSSPSPIFPASLLSRGNPFQLVELFWQAIYLHLLNNVLIVLFSWFIHRKSIDFLLRE